MIAKTTWTHGVLQSLIVAVTVTLVALVFAASYSVHPPGTTAFYEMLLMGGATIFLYVFLGWLLISLIRSNIRAYPRLLRLAMQACIVLMVWVIANIFEGLGRTSALLQVLFVNDSIRWMLALFASLAVAAFLSVALTTKNPRSD